MKKRNTRQKMMIRQAINGMDIHRTAEEILASVQEIDPSIGLATVYRNLNDLCEQGEIQKLNYSGTTIYDGNPKPHNHFYCQKCGKLCDVELEYDEQMDHSVASRMNVRVLSHSITFEGICEECLKKEEKSWN